MDGRTGTYRGQYSACEKQMTFRRDGTPHATHKRPDGNICPGSVGGREPMDAGDWLRSRGWKSNDDGTIWAMVNPGDAYITTRAAVVAQLNIEGRHLLERMGF